MSDLRNVCSFADSGVHIYCVVVLVSFSVLCTLC